MKQKRKELRADMKRLLENLDRRWVRAASAQLCEELEKLLRTEPFSEKEKVLMWTSFFPGEVDLSCLIEKIIGERAVYLPRSNADFTMQFLSIGNNWSAEVEPGIYGIPEPLEGGGVPFHPAVDGEDTVILVPGLAFDKLGNRIGRGKGYYDRFLGQAGMLQALRIGVCWELQIVERISPDIHDIPVHAVCAEEEYFLTGLS
ncbi:5-formyltetrahydrofolate cyclo-ligase [bacterium]|nr:5-formyltetrahydrofolate cyclo-ligase [bacterium]